MRMVTAVMTATVLLACSVQQVYCADTASETAGSNAGSSTSADSDLKKQFQAAEDAASKGDFATAEPLYEKVLKNFSDADRTVDKAVASLGLAQTQYQLGKYDKALELLKFCLPIFKTEKKADPDDYGTATEMLSRTYRHLGQLDEATTYAHVNREFVIKRFGTKSIEYALSQRNLGKLFLEKARYADAEVAFKDCLAIFDNPELKTDPENIATCLSLLIDSLTAQKKDSDCVAYQQRLDAMQKKETSSSPTPETSSSEAKAANPTSLLGMTLADARKQDVFTFFHFQELKRLPPNNGITMVVFEAECMGNRALLMLEVSGKEETISAASLMLPRKFVDGSFVGVFARDLAKSFLMQAVPDGDLPACQTTISEIAFGGQKTEPVKAGEYKVDVVGGTKTSEGFKEADPKSVPKLPDTPTAGYAAYLGKQQTFRQEYKNCRIAIMNSDAEGGSVLTIIVVALPEIARY